MLEINLTKYIQKLYIRTFIITDKSSKISNNENMYLVMDCKF